MTAQVAFLFPGQGSQFVGMGADIYANSPAACHVFDSVDEALGFPLSQLCFQGPEELLRETINTQPAIVTVSLALLAAFQESLSPRQHSWSSPLTPAFTAGHSVGEYAALVVAGALDLNSAVRLVRERGQLMHHEGTVCPSGMAAIIALDEAILQEVCQQATTQALADLSEESTGSTRHPGQGKVIIANYNAPGQIVISGEQRALELAMSLAKARGAKKVIPLSVSGAFHSPVMQPAASGLAQAIATMQVHDATIPIISNISATPLTDAQAIQNELAQQISSPVQWTQTIQYMAKAGVSTFIEIGPGQALKSMIKRIDRSATILNIGNAAELEEVASLVREMDFVRDV